MRVAFLADIHGNLPALEAVIADLSAQKPDQVYLVGDQINRCPWSVQVLDLIGDMGWAGICGNHETVLLRLEDGVNTSPFDDRRRFPDLWWTLSNLSPRHLDMIRQLPSELVLHWGNGAGARLVHGVPGNPFQGVFVDTPAEHIRDMYAGTEARIVVCGHTHWPLRRTVPGLTLFNGGSVGIPYNGDPRAQYLMLTQGNGAWHPTYRRVEYPVRYVQQEFRRQDLMAAYGPLAGIHIRTVVRGEPWASDFGHWLSNQPPEIHQDLENAVTLYERSHGPGKWSFLERQIHP